MTLKKQIKIFRKYLEDGWSLSVSCAKSGITPDVYRVLLKENEEVKELNLKYKKSIIKTDLRYLPRG